MSTSASHLEQFARQGLRTLCVAFKEISQEEYDIWLPDYQSAQTSLSNRDALISQAAESIECNLYLLGVSAIEDKLQVLVKFHRNFLYLRTKYLKRFKH